MAKSMTPVEMCDRLNDAIEKLLLLDEVLCSDIDADMCSSGLVYVVHGVVDDIQDVFSTIDTMREEEQSDGESEVA